MENTCSGAFFGKVADPQPAILSKNELNYKKLLIGLSTF